MSGQCFLGDCDKDHIVALAGEVGHDLLDGEDHFLDLVEVLAVDLDSLATGGGHSAEIGQFYAILVVGDDIIVIGTGGEAQRAHRHRCGDKE